MATHDPIPLPIFSANDCKRFWAKVQSGHPAECWPWKAKTSHGYGYIRLGTMQRSHRIAYQMHFGVDIRGVCVLHSCDNPPCCNPFHLFLGSQHDNIQDMIFKGRQGVAGAAGERHGHAKLNNSQVLLIRQLSKQESQKALAKQFGVTRRTINLIIRRETWKHL